MNRNGEFLAALSSKSRLYFSNKLKAKSLISIYSTDFYGVCSCIDSSEFSIIVWTSFSPLGKYSSALKLSGFLIELLFRVVVSEGALIGNSCPPRS